MKWIKFCFVVAMIPGLLACEKENNGDKITELNLELSKSKILDDGDDTVVITVLNQDSKDVSDKVQIYANLIKLTTTSFISTDTGVFVIHAEHRNITSNSEEVTVVVDEGLSFMKNVLLEQFTGTWCGYCPRAIEQISTLMAINNKVSHIAYHLNDGFGYSYNFELYNSLQYEYIPVVAADRSITWEGSIAEIANMHEPQRIGISMSVEGDCDELDVTVSLKFGKIFTKKIALSVYVVHDSLIANQENYYNDDPSSVWYQQGHPMVDFVHENVMIKTATNMFGDIIPKASIDIGSVYEQNYSIGNFTCNDINNIEVVAFVVYKTGIYESTVLNSMVCTYGESKDYELAVK